MSYGDLCGKCATKVGRANCKTYRFALQFLSFCVAFPIVLVIKKPAFCCAILIVLHSEGMKTMTRKPDFTAKRQFSFSGMRFFVELLKCRKSQYLHTDRRMIACHFCHTVVPLLSFFCHSLGFWHTFGYILSEGGRLKAHSDATKRREGCGRLFRYRITLINKNF